MLRFRRRNSLLLGLGLAWVGFGFPVWAADVLFQLKNGDRVTGRIVVESAERIELETQWGQLTIPVSAIEKRQAVEAAPVQPVPPKPGQRTVQETAQALRELFREYEAGTLSPVEYHRRRAELLQGIDRDDATRAAVVKAPSPPPDAPPPSAAAGEKPKSRHQWSGQAQVGADLGYGTKQRQLFTGRLKLTHAYDRFRSVSDYQFSYGRTDEELSANRMDGSLKGDWDLNKTWYFYNLGGAGYDEVRRIDLKYEVGPGVGAHLYKVKGLAISAETGMNYYAELREGPDHRERFYFRFAELLTWKLNSKLSLDEKLEWFPEAEDFHSYRIRFESNLQYLLASNISLVLSVLDQYETEPAAGVDNNDLQVRSLLGVKF